MGKAVYSRHFKILIVLACFTAFLAGSGVGFGLAGGGTSGVIAAADRPLAATAVMLSLALAGTMAASLVGYLVLTRVHRPLMRLRATLLALAEGIPTGPVPHTEEAGAVGSLARAVRRIQHSLAERDAALAALRLSEDRLSTALSITPVVVFNLDRELRYTWMYNPQIPIPPADFIGKSGADIFEPEGYAKREFLFRRAMATGQPTSDNVVLRMKGGNADIHIHQMASPMWENGNIVGLVCAAVNVTERERDKAALQAAADEARRANAAKSRFLAAASHDLRQPVQALRLFLDALDLQLRAPADRRALAGALTALSACEDLLRSLLDVSVLEAGLINPRPRSFPIGDVLVDLEREFAGPALQKGLDLRILTCGRMVHSDQRMLHGLLRNLLANAVRYTDAGGILVGCRRTGTCLRIEVWDTGIGIAADQIDAVFEDFYQIGNLERDRAKGLGLGLGLVDRTARLLGHRVTAASRPGRGSVFAVTVPLATDPATGRAAA